jgi:hypothetical protein
MNADLTNNDRLRLVMKAHRDSQAGLTALAVCFPVIRTGSTVKDAPHFKAMVKRLLVDFTCDARTGLFVCVHHVASFVEFANKTGNLLNFQPLWLA